MIGDFKNRRRNYFIKKKFQSFFIIKFCILVILGAVLSGIIVYKMSSSTVTTSFENSRLKIKSTAEYILPAVVLSSTIVVVTIGLATIVVTLFTSHRIAGPLYRIEKDLEQLSSGNLTVRFRVREGDEIKALAVGLDSMSQKLRADMDSIKHSVDEMAKSTDAAVIKRDLETLQGELKKFAT